jgi:hypothetical protein
LHVCAELFEDRLEGRKPTMEVDARLDLLGLLGEGNTLVGDFLFQVRNGRDVPIVIGSWTSTHRV